MLQAQSEVIQMSALQDFPRIFTEAVSFVVRCDSQQEVDDYWSKLSAGGSELQCGWFEDKFGPSWQIVPARPPDLIKHPKAIQAVLQMEKLDIAELELVTWARRYLRVRADETRDAGHRGEQPRGIQTSPQWQETGRGFPAPRLSLPATR